VRIGLVTDRLPYHTPRRPAAVQGSQLMRNIRKTIWIIVFSFVAILVTGLCTSLHAQQTGVISGMVRSSDKKPVDAATVSLLKIKDSSLIKISVTSKAGIYEFLRLKKGSYLLQVTAVGHSKYLSDPIVLGTDSSRETTADIGLQQLPVVIGGVTVLARKPLVENKIDRTVVNVDASTTNTGLSALEILEKSPGVTVDNDGNVSLKGKQGVVILIDGKQTYLNAKDLANYLRNMPSNQLDQVEIMTQPPAKYDATGNSGVINLVTKKSKNVGFSGTATTSAIIAKYFKNTNSLTFNWRNGKTNFYGNYGYSWWEGFNDIHTNKSLRQDAATPFNRYVEQYTFGRYSDRAHTFRAGVDYFADKKTTLGISVNGTVDKGSFTSVSQANIFDSLHHFVQVNDANSQTRSPQTNLGFNLDLQRKMSGDKELSVDADYIFYNTPGTSYTNNYLYNSDKTPSEEPYLLDGQLPSRIDIYSLRSDYKQSLKGNATLEAGVKSSYVRTDNNAVYTLFDNSLQKWTPDTTISNHFIYKENINAAYLSLRKQIKKLTAQIGLRAEQTVSDGDQTVKKIAFHKNYLQVFPTAYFSYQRNDNNIFGLSYGRRVERPGYQDLNPFQSQLDRYTYDQGNPNLQPQFSHNFELSYNFKGQLNVTANYTVTTDIISGVLLTVKQPGDSNYTTINTSQNLASLKTIGLSVNYSRQITKWWSLNVFGNLYNNHYIGSIDGQAIDLNLTSFNGNFSSQFNFSGGWSGEISGFYNAKSYDGGAVLSYGRGMFSLGGGKKIWKDKAAIKLNLRDPFYLMNYHTDSELDKSHTQAKYVWDNRRIILTLVYRFGRSGNSGPEHKSSAGDEQSRVKSGGGNN